MSEDLKTITAVSAVIPKERFLNHADSENDSDADTAKDTLVTTEDASAGKPQPLMLPINIDSFDWTRVAVDMVACAFIGYLLAPVNDYWGDLRVALAVASAICLLTGNLYVYTKGFTSSLTHAYKCEQLDVVNETTVFFRQFAEELSHAGEGGPDDPGTLRIEMFDSVLVLKASRR